jgi:hypothetical protein
MFVGLEFQRSRGIELFSNFYTKVSLITFSDDPYYCGLRARVPNFVKANSKANNPIDNNSNYVSSSNLNKAMKEKESKRMLIAQAQPSHTSLHHNNSNSNSNLYLHHQQLHHSASHNMMAPHHQPPYMWHTRSYESGIGLYHNHHLREMRDYRKFSSQRKF